MRLMRALIRILKYYLVIHLTTLFIYIYNPAAASTFYILSLLSLVPALIYRFPVRKYLLLNILLAITLSAVYFLGPLVIAIILIAGLLLWRDIILLLR